MNPQPTIARHIVSADLRVKKLLQETCLVGGIYTMGFVDCLALSRDLCSPCLTTSAQTSTTMR